MTIGSSELVESSDDETLDDVNGDAGEHLLFEGLRGKPVPDVHPVLGVNLGREWTRIFFN